MTSHFHMFTKPFWKRQKWSIHVMNVPLQQTQDVFSGKDYTVIQAQEGGGKFGLWVSFGTETLLMWLWWPLPNNQHACLHLPLVLLQHVGGGWADDQLQSPPAQAPPGNPLFKFPNGSDCLTKVEGDACAFLPFLSPQEKLLLEELVRDKVVEMMRADWIF